MVIKTVSIKQAYKQWAGKYEQDLPYLFESESEKIMPLLGNVKGKRILDLGCGTGRYSIALAKKGAIVTAVDFSEEMLSMAKDKAKNAKVKIDFKCIDLKKKFPFKKESFDIVLSMLVLGHFKNLEPMINKISKVLKLDGTCMISTFNPNKEGGKMALVQSLGLDARKYSQTKEEYINAIKKAKLSLEKYLEIKFSKQAVFNAKKDGVNLKPYSHKPFLIAFKIRKKINF